MYRTLALLRPAASFEAERSVYSLVQLGQSTAHADEIARKRSLP